MPIPLPPTPPTQVTATPYWDQPQMPHAISNVRGQTEGAVRRLGEYSAWVLLWNLEDHEEGLVDRCPTCYDAGGSKEAAYAAAYGQTGNPECPDCLGTTFEGGYRAIIVRPTLWSETEEASEQSKRGEVTRQSARLQSTADFRAKVNDWVLRHDGTRWEIGGVENMRLHTGFTGGGTRDRVGVGYSYTAAREDQSSVIFQQLLSDVELGDLDINEHTPVDWSGVEDIRGPLL
jgi:hypothetical protein